MATGGDNTGLLVGRFSKVLVVVLTVVTVATFVWIDFRTTSLLEGSVLEQARSYVDLTIAARSWNSDYGGVYVKKTAHATTNPFLEELGVDADDQLLDGTSVTLRNPAAMTREIGEKLQRSAQGSSLKVTSLQFGNPANAPDAWERQTLEGFESGATEGWTVAEGDAGAKVYRYMRPLFIEQGCLTCHSSSGYQVGDVRGAISIMLPYERITRALRQNRLQLAAIASAVLLGLWGMVFGLVGWLRRRLRDAEERLERMATTDELTGLQNRRSILESLERELDRAKRDGSSVGAVLLDIDHFKHANDTYGHAVGDEALRQVAFALKRVLRPYDIVGRIGGEEMLVVAPAVQSAELSALAERLRSAVDAIDASGLGEGAHLTVSAGTALVSPAMSETTDALIARADAAMYAAKAAGRNRVVAG